MDQAADINQIKDSALVIQSELVNRKAEKKRKIENLDDSSSSDTSSVNEYY